MNHPLSSSVFQLPEAASAQVDEARYRLHGDATAAGVPLALVDEAVSRAVDDFRNAHVQAFIGVLVERQVRDALGLHPLLEGAD